MTLAFAATIDGATLRCHVTADRDMAAPVLCYSMMSPNIVLSGGTQLRALGSYSEVSLPDLRAGEPHEVVLRHKNPDYRPANRAWLPLGPYLRLNDGTTLALPQPWASGVRMGEAPVDAPLPSEGLALVPPPTEWRPSAGTLDLGAGISTDHEAFRTVAAIKAGARGDNAPFLAATGAPVEISHDAALPPEGYRLELTPQVLRVATADRSGILYAAVTLRNLQIIYGGTVPCGTITDAPRFGWRGQHLDCARHFFAPETIHDLLDLMLLFKLNRFHWHFADDEAFRLEVDCLPELWQKTAFRGEGQALPGLFGGGIRAGGSYSKADVAAIVDHAARNGIEVLPEIEVPAHALAMNAAIPGLRDPGDTGTEQSVQGYANNTINPALPRMWEVTEALADEVADLFPFGHLHLGCDELPDDTWAGSPLVDALKTREGLADTDDVQAWTMDRIAAHLVARGIRPAAWEEAARGAGGGIGNGAILFSWTGQGPGIEAARAGYDVVMSPAQHIYLDMAHSPDPDDWGASWAAFTGLEDTVNWSPVPNGAEDIAQRVIGIEATFWSEFTTQDTQLWPMLMPRMLGVACKAWDQNDSIDGPRLRQIADRYRATMEGFWDWNYRA